MDVQIAIAPAGEKKVMIGFSSDVFSQCMFFPVENIRDAESFALGFYNAFVTAAEEALGIPAPKDSNGNSVNDDSSGQ